MTLFNRKSWRSAGQEWLEHPLNRRHVVLQPGGEEIEIDAYSGPLDPGATTLVKTIASRLSEGDHEAEEHIASILTLCIQRRLDELREHYT